ncbi:hypothetical protein DPEC_G00216560 [Dallia pectoralis]|uniref:Uncharacterized protein n=1 Tax=Dallia pectoralis TaxID=75939 RepID=A0ACC2G2W1_DALPE|nr:hypothetical protein DPEC_G00216560 [Dallia pectoralis]
MIPCLINNSLLIKPGPFLSLNQSEEFCGRFENSRWYCYVLLVLFTFALPVGILGNVAALLNYTCFRTRSLSTSNVFLLHLALCDSAWLLTLPFTIYFNLQKPYLRIVQTFCQLKKIVFNVNIYGSIFFLTLISFDRYAGTVHPISSLRWWGVGKAKLCSACVWVFLLLASIPDLFMTFASRRPWNETTCTDVHIQGPFVFVKTISISRTLVGFALPFSVMLGFYAMTVRVLRGLSGGKTRGSRGQWTGKPLMLISAALLVFVVSFVPYHVMIMTLLYLKIRGQVTPDNEHVLYASYEFFEAMCSVSSCLDPVLYILASERFQKRLRALRRGHYRALCCRRSRRVGVEG